MWRHKSRNSMSYQKECLLEWKRAKGGVAVQECDESLTHRVTISGDYNRHECGLTISGVTAEDAGVWECEVRFTYLSIYSYFVNS